MSCRDCVCLQRQPRLKCLLGGGEICAEDVDAEDGQAVCAFNGPFEGWDEARRAEATFEACQVPTGDERVEWSEPMEDGDLPLAIEVCVMHDDGARPVEIIEHLQEEYGLTVTHSMLSYALRRGRELLDEARALPL